MYKLKKKKEVVEGRNKCDVYKVVNGGRHGETHTHTQLTEFKT